MHSHLNYFSDFPILETDRLFLKPLNKNYLSKEYVVWLNDPEVNKYMSSGGDYTIQKLSEYLDDVEKNPKYFWAIILKESNRHIGNIKIDPINYKEQHGVYGIMIGDKNYWGKGIAREASLRVIDFCFNKLNLKRISLLFSRSNKSALKLYEKIGFSQEVNFNEDNNFEKEFYDNIRMNIFNSLTN